MSSPTHGEVGQPLAPVLAQGERVSRPGVWIWDPFTDHRVGPAQTYRLFGFAADEPTAIALQKFPLRIHEQDQQRFEDEIARARREVTDFDVSYRIQHPDGDVRHMHAIGHPVLDARGTVREFIGTVVDLTERHRADEMRARQLQEAALRAEISAVLTRADTLRAILQGCTDALVRRLGVAFARVWTLRQGSDVLELDASSGLYTHLDGPHGRIRVGELKIGLIAEERSPHLTNDVQHDPRVSDKAWAAREGVVAFAGYPLIVEDRVVGVMAMFSRRPLADETLATLGSIADAIAQGIERKRAADELRRSEAYLAEGQRLSRTGSWAWNPATGVLFWSREMYRIYGFDPNDGPPPYDVLLSRLHPADLPAANRIAEESVRDLKEFDMGYRVVHQDGSVIHIRTVGHPVLAPDGTLIEFIGTVVDVTEQKRAERRLRRAIRARYRAALDERLRLARDMHDGLLQNVTGLALQLHATLLRLRAAPNDEALPTLERILDLAERTSREAREAVVGMRSEPRLEDLAAAIEHAARQAVAPAPVVCSLMVTGRVRRVRSRVQRALVHLVREAVTNVVKHADASNVRVLVAFRRKLCRVSVSDDGRGFSVATGLSATGHFGLVGMRERAEEIGASLEIQSTPGAGTTVIIDVPYCARPS